MKNGALCLSLCICSVFAHAEGVSRSMDADVTCGNSPRGVQYTGEPPVININYSPGGDVGKPGLFYIGVLTPQGNKGAFFTGNSWIAPGGGLFPFYSRHDGGFPSSLRVKVPFPGAGLTTGAYVGYEIYAGHGVLTAAGRAQVNEHNELYRQAQQPRTDGGLHHIQTLVQGDLMTKSKYNSMGVIPFIDCTLKPLVEQWGGAG